MLPLCYGLLPAVIIIDLVFRSKQVNEQQGMNVSVVLH